MTDPLPLFALVVWIGMATFWDLRVSRILPLPLLLIGILFCVARTFLQGNPLLAFVILVVIGVSNSDIVAIRIAGIFPLIAIIFLQHSPALAFGWLIFWLFWEFHIWGGGDALLCIISLASYPGWSMLYGLAIGLGIVGLAITIWKYRHSFWARMKLVGMRSLLKDRSLLRDWPQAQEMESQGYPATPGILLGVMIYALSAAT